MLSTRATSSFLINIGGSAQFVLTLPFKSPILGLVLYHFGLFSARECSGPGPYPFAVVSDYGYFDSINRPPERATRFRPFPASLFPLCGGIRSQLLHYLEPPRQTGISVVARSPHISLEWCRVELLHLRNDRSRFESSGAFGHLV